MTKLNKIISNNIIRLRKSVGWSQVELSRHSKVTSAGICMIEKGHRCPSVPVLIRIADALKVSIEEIIQPKIEDTEFRAFHRKFSTLKNLSASDQLLIIKIAERLL